MSTRLAAVLALTIAATLIPLPSRAQGNAQPVLPEGYLQLLAGDLRKERVHLLTQAMAFTPDQASIFWPIYEEYEVESSALWDARSQLIADYAARLMSMTNDQASVLAQQAMGLEASRMSLRQRYFTRVEEAISSIVAARFLQVEGQINLLVDLQISQQMPLIGQTQ